MMDLSAGSVIRWKLKSEKSAHFKIYYHTRLSNLPYEIRKHAMYFVADEPRSRDLSAVSVIEALGSMCKSDSEKLAHCQIHYHTTNFTIQKKNDVAPRRRAVGYD